MDFAEKLVAAANHDGVRVTELREGWSTEQVIFEHLATARQKPIKIVQETQATFCKSLADYYAFPARITMGRIMRAYLDQNNITQLELMFNVGHLRTLDRMDQFFPSAMQHGAQLQAKLTGQKKIDRLDKLQTVFEKVLNRARKSDDLIVYGDALGKHSLDHVIDLIEQEYDSKQVDRVVCGALANHLEGTNWREKLNRAVSLAEGTHDDRGLQFADELIAEILDGVAVIDEVFGGFQTAINAWKTYMQIVSGRLDKVPSYMSPDLPRLSALFAQHNLPATRQVFMSRIARGLASTQAISGDAREENRIAFVELVRELIEPTGLSGGPAMAEAVVLRTKTLLGEDGADLPIETAIRQALYLMPSQAGRLGVLLDLTPTGVGQKYDGVIRQQLLHLLNQLHTIFDLFPSDIQEDERLIGLEQLRDRLGMSVLHDDLRSSLSDSLVRLREAQNESGDDQVPEPSQSNQPEILVPSEKQVDGQRILSAGEVLFEEGDTGEEAYFILDGQLEISRKYGNKKQKLATVGKGEIVGEMSLIDSQPRMASAHAVERTTLLCISSSSLRGRMDKLAGDDQVLHFLIKTLVRRLRGLARNTE
ncbi:MAG: cyclic nucleotide-binding domain-containing protein [Magnetovibrio sp.]|nr:cyclic nucleotide-binding domain-containing protein [Magnetovibrio sp.]